MTEIIAFVSSRQPHYGGCGSGEKQTRGSSEYRESCPNVQKKIEWLGPPQLLIPGVILVSLDGGLCGDPRAIFSLNCLESPTLWGLHLRGQSLLQYGPLQNGHGVSGNLDSWEHLFRYLLSTSPSLFIWVPSGHFSSGYFRTDLTVIVGASVYCLVLFCSFPPHILYHNIAS